jgi:acetoin utilization deacetylase AcuC-like enzyme
MTYIIADPLFKDHLTGFNHPESPERYDAIMNHLKGYPIFSPRDATEEDLLRCHTASYIHLVQKEIIEGQTTLSTGDVNVSAKSYKAALRAVGAVLTAVDLVMENKTKRVFCVVRPPGHHACSDMGMGFCLFNNIAIGARYAQEKYQIKRVLIVDWDVHHGNGTQEIFHEDPSIFYFSTHQFPLYPGTGAASEKGAGTIYNVPIMAGETAREEVLQAYKETLQMEMEKFRPELVMISAGFDAHKDDPLGGLKLNTEDYATLTEAVKKVADKYASGRIISVLEGGYNLKALEEAAKVHVGALEA